MKKKLIALMCVLSCIFVLAGCGNKQTAYSEQELTKLSNSELIASSTLDLAASVDAESLELITSYNKEEVKAIYEQSMYSAFGIGVEAELGAFEGLLQTYNQMLSDMGGLNQLGSTTSEIVGDSIIVTVDVIGNECNGKITFTFTNDIFTRFEEGNAVAKTSLKQKLEEAGTHMGDAGLNTLLGMGSVFIVLILISLIIGCFETFNGSKKKKEDVVVNEAPVETESEELADDTELVAVIMAAISAFEGNASTDGFVVRSIKKANRRN